AKALRYGLEGLAEEDAHDIRTPGAREAARELGMMVDLLGEATDARMLAESARRASDAPLAVQASLLAHAEAETQRVHATLSRLLDAGEWPALAPLLPLSGPPARSSTT